MGSQGTLVNNGVINENSSQAGASYIQGHFINQGAINARTADDSLDIDPADFTNSGVIDAAGGAYILVNPTTFTNLTAHTLTGGTYEVENNSAIQLNVLSTNSIQTLAANVILSGSASAGANAGFKEYYTNTGVATSIDATLRTIAATGRLQILNNRNFSLVTNDAFTNNGLINLGGGAIVGAASGASLTDAAGARIVGFGAINVATFANSGTVEASGGTLAFLQNVAGSGLAQIDSGATLILSQGLSGSVVFAGDNATLQINNPSLFTATLGGFSLGDTIFLPNATVTGASVNFANQLVLKKGATTVATFNLDAPYANIYLLPLAVSGGVDIVALPLLPTVAQYLALPLDYNLIPEGVAISDTAANIAANLGALGDPHIAAIVASGTVSVSAASAATNHAALDKIAGGFVVFDTAQNLASALPTLTDAHIESIVVSDSAPVRVSVAALSSAATEIGLLVNAGGGPIWLAVFDSAIALSAGLDGLNGANIASITVSDSAAVLVSVAQLASDATTLAKLVNAAATPVSLTVKDTAQHISNALGALAASSIGAIVVADNSAVGVSSAQLAADAAALAKLVNANATAATLAVSDSAASIALVLDQLNGANIASITILDNQPVNVSVGQLTSDASALSKLANANATPYKLAVAGAAAQVTSGLAALQANFAHISSIATNGAVIVNATTFGADQGALDRIAGGFKVSDSAPNILAALSTLNADSHVTGLAVISGTATLGSGVVFQAPSLTETGATTSLSVAENLIYTGAFSQGVKATLDVAAGHTLTLKGGANLAGVVSGAGALTLSNGASAILSPGASLTVAKWTLTGAGTNATLNESLGYAGAFTQGAGTAVSISTGDILLLKGASTLGGR